MKKKATYAADRIAMTYSVELLRYNKDNSKIKAIIDDANRMREMAFANSAEEIGIKSFNQLPVFYKSLLKDGIFEQIGLFYDLHGKNCSVSLIGENFLTTSSVCNDKFKKTRVAPQTKLQKLWKKVLIQLSFVGRSMPEPIAVYPDSGRDAAVLKHL
jgi:hypothetical protein